MNTETTKEVAKEKYESYLVKAEGFDGIFDKRIEAQREYEKLKTKLLGLKVGFKLQLLGSGTGKTWHTVECTTVANKFFENEKKKFA